MNEAAPKPARKPRSQSAAKKSPPPPAPNPPVLRNVGLIAALIVLIDQQLKYIVIHVMQLDRIREIDLIDPWLNLRMAWNQGMNFGLFSSDANMARWVLIGISMAVCAWVLFWVGRSRPSILAQISAGFLIGGAIGNVIDRLTYGAVVDFLNMSLPNWHNPFSFNVADIAIFLGAIGLVLQPPENKAKPQPVTVKPRKPRAPAKPKTVAAQPDAAQADDKTRDEQGK